MTTTTKTTDANKAPVVAGITGIFIDRDPAVLDRLFSNDCRQHNPQIANGTAALKVLLGKLPADFKYEPGLVMADGDYVSITAVISDGDLNRWWPWVYFASLMARSQSIGT
jgi:predicted SnoaL-like aldol condensation-catalyzing enzyme